MTIAQVGHIPSPAAAYAIPVSIPQSPILTFPPNKLLNVPKLNPKQQPGTPPPRVTSPPYSNHKPTSRPLKKQSKAPTPSTNHTILSHKPTNSPPPFHLPAFHAAAVMPAPPPVRCCPATTVPQFSTPGLQAPILATCPYTAMAWEGPHASLGLPGQGWARGKMQWEAGTVEVEGEVVFPQEQKVPVVGVRG